MTLTRQQDDVPEYLIRARQSRGELVYLHIKQSLVWNIQVETVPGLPVVDAADATVLPGLWDHHRHFHATIARARSVDVSAVTTVDAFIEQLAKALGHRPAASARFEQSPWLRVVGYDDRILGPLDAARLHELHPTSRAIKVQHRSGHQWVINRPGLEQLATKTQDPISPDGVLWHDDPVLTLTSGTDIDPYDISHALSELTAQGCVGFTDLTADSPATTFNELQRRVGETIGFDAFGLVGQSSQWGVKIMLQEHDLPDPDELMQSIRTARPGRVAIHTVTAESLVIATWALQRVGAPDDRLEHVFTTPKELPADIAHAYTQTAGSQLPAVCVNPGFIRTHGDRHLRYGDPQDIEDYQRLRTWAQAGFTLLGGSDAPFSNATIWEGMQAAVDRSTKSGQILQPDETLSPEEAFTLFTSEGLGRSGVRVDVQVGDPADLSLVAQQWCDLRTDFAQARILATIRAGKPEWLDPSIAWET